MMHRPWPVSHPNGRSDKGSLSGGPEEIISRSHALTPLERVSGDVIIPSERFGKRAVWTRDLHPAKVSLSVGRVLIDEWRWALNEAPGLENLRLSSRSWDFSKSREKK